MPRLKGELENTVSEVSAGHPSSEFPLLVLPQGKPETLPEDQRSFHFPGRAWSPTG